MTLAVAAVLLAAGLTAEWTTHFEPLALALFWTSIVVGGAYPLRSAIRAVRNRRLTTTVLMELAPPSANRLTAGDLTETVAAEELHPGDVVLIHTGQGHLQSIGGAPKHDVYRGRSHVTLSKHAEACTETSALQTVRVPPERCRHPRVFVPTVPPEQIV